MYALTWLFLVFMAVTYSSTAISQQLVFPDERYKIVLTIAGKKIAGGQELAARLSGMPGDNAAYDTPPPTIRRGESFQAKVRVTNPAGVVKDYTRSTKLRYESFDCLAVTSSGIVTVVPVTGGQCSLPDLPRLWIVLTDASGNPIAMNSYMFQVTP